MHSRHQIYLGITVRSGPSPVSRTVEDLNLSMQSPIYYPKAEFIETVCVTCLTKGHNLRCDGQGHGEQSLASRDDFRTSEYHPRREDDHFERCHHPRRLEARWSWTRRGHLFGALLSRGGRMRHEVRLRLSRSFARRNLIPSWSVQAPLQDVSWCIQLLPDEGR
jgi:hypothetical protein